ncbi:hypothetical protein KKG90_09640, partial [Candidatus Bipolaricaulota bacterium]|nr:hypothetical protein [Candidatus Bipolaricaulota bacterium]
MHTDRFKRRLFAAFGVLVGLLLVACSRQDAQVDRTAESLETAERVLGEAMQGYFTNPVYDTEWDLENAETQLDEEKFPTWARDRYDACVYWHTTFWTEVYNNDRRPGNSTVFIQRPGEGWGWILVGKQGVYVLELGYQFDDAD